MKSKNTKLYFDIHVFYGTSDGYSTFVAFDKHLLTDDYNKDDVVSLAVDKGLLNVDDMVDVDRVTKISKQEYNRSMN